MNELVNTLNGLVWSPALIYLCLGVGLYFSLGRSEKAACF